MNKEGRTLKSIFNDNSERKKVKTFILSREQPEGGFSFSKLTPPTREDTYFALRSFDTLSIKYSSKKNK